MEAFVLFASIILSIIDFVTRVIEIVLRMAELRGKATERRKPD